MSPKIVFCIEDKEVTKKEYDAEFQKQNILYGSCVQRSSLNEDTNEFVFSILDYAKVYKTTAEISKEEGE